MKSPDYFDLKQYVQETSSISHVALDSILSKLDTQNLRDLKEVLKDFYEATKETSEDAYREGYRNGFYEGRADDPY